MARERPPSAGAKPWILESAPLLVVVLLAAHVLALVYWLFKLASQKLPEHRKIR